MIAALKQVEAGRAVEDVAREVGIESHHLRLEGEGRRHGCEPGAGSEAVAGGEQPDTDAGGGPEPTKKRSSR
jgi:hypothetical protein